MLAVWYGAPSANQQFLTSALRIFPTDGSLWMYLAIVDSKANDWPAAKTAVQTAAANGDYNAYFYSRIMNEEPVTVPSRPTVQ